MADTVTLDQVLERLGLVGKEVKEAVEGMRAEQIKITERVSAFEVELKSRGAPGAKPKVRLHGVLRCLKDSRNNLDDAGAWKGFEKERDDGRRAIERAMVAGIDSQGGFLITEETDPGMIELLRAESVIASLGLRKISNLKGSPFVMRKITQGATHVWGTEGVAPDASALRFGVLELNPRRSQVFVPVSNQLIRQADPSVEAIVRDDMAVTAALAHDLAYLYGTGGKQPLGLKTTPNVQTVAISGSPDLDDIAAMLLKLMEANAFRGNIGWVMSPRTWNSLRTLKDGVGRYLLDWETKTLAGLPFKITTQIPNTLGAGGAESDLWLGNWADLVDADWGPMEVKVSDVAGGPSGSAFLQDETWFLMNQLRDSGPRQPLSFVVGTGVAA